MSLSHCRACTWTHHCIEGSGPRPCDIMFLGEGPARDEIRKGYPFAGRSGAEYDIQYLPLAGLDRRDVYTSNVSKCPFPGLRNPTKDEALICARQHLPAELTQVNPKIIVTMGAVAASVFDTTHTPGSLGRPIDLELDYGRYTRASFGHWSGWLIPTYHPAAAMREPRFARPIRETFMYLPLMMRMLLDESDWRKVRPLVEDPHPEPLYTEILSPLVLLHTLAAYEPYQDLAIDTETDDSTPWSLQFSFRPGAGYLIDAGRHDLLVLFRTWLQLHRPLVALHFALADLDTLSNMDPPIHLPRWVDTGMLAYHAQEFSQGLKPLASRLCGMSMTDYDDVVLPHSLVAVEAYAVDVVSYLDSHYRYDHIFKSGARKGQSEPRFRPDTPDSIRYTYARYTALLRDISEPPDEFDPWKRTTKWDPEAHIQSESIIGRAFPVKSISHVPRPQAIHYACRDADATLRILPLMRRRARAMGANVLVSE